MSSQGWSLLAALCVCLVRLDSTTVAAGEGPLPSGESVKEDFAKRLAESQGEKEDFEERYRHVRTRSREERNTQGKVKDRTVERQVHDPRQRESESDENAGGGRYGERDIVVDDELLKRFAFEVEGREWVDGREALRVAFRPVSDHLPKHSTLDRFINRTAGTLWLEESTSTLLKGQMGLLEQVNFLAGIAGVVYRLDVTFERAPTPEGIWYTRSSAWYVDYRTFLVRKVVQSEERREEIQRVESEAALNQSP